VSKITPTLVLDVVGLSPSLLGPHTPQLNALAKVSGARPIETITPAVTCSVQSTFVTGALPREHGIVGNGWYFRDLSEVWLWRQSNKLVHGDKLWDRARAIDPNVTVANLFWWYAMYANVNATVTPRPQYLADGRKAPDIYTDPPELRDTLNASLGEFPLFNFWGPNANIVSSQWIGNAAKHVINTQSPSLTLVYLPHLDYCLQKYGPNDPRIPEELRAIDAVCGELIALANQRSMRTIVLSEYGIVDVSGPVHINRALREAGLLKVRVERDTELLDPGASDAFAVSDHQIAHVYVKDPRNVAKVKALIAKLDGVEHVLDEATKPDFGLDHERSGELIALSAPDRWFTYYYWLDDKRAPDFARCVEIHRKPGYDPVEMFLDPTLVLPKAQVALRVAKKLLGFRMLMNVIPLDATLVKGSHGRITKPEHGPLLLSNASELLRDEPLHATHVKDLILRHLFG
jgi:predicted AlkP superfamily pyrophosphatase or phosphodiesterase